MMSKHWHSSPTRELGSFDVIEERQRARASRLYQPMSSPIKMATNTDQRHKLREQIKQKREEIRQGRQELSREKTVHDEDVKTRLRVLQEQAESLETSLEFLLQEEYEAQQEKQQDLAAGHLGAKNQNIYDRESGALDSRPPDINDPQYLAELEEQFEDFLADEELELEAQLRDLQL